MILSDISTFSRGNIIPTSKLKPGKYPVITGGAEIKQYTDQYNRIGETIAVSSSGSAGYVSFWDEPIFVTDAFTIEVNSDMADRKYIYFLLKSLQTQIMNKAKGSIIPHVYPKDVSTIKIPNSSLVAQREIGRLLSSIDKLIKDNCEQCDLLDKIIRLIYNYWFVQFDFPDENGRPYKSSGGKMVYNDQLKQEIPEGWECKKLIGLFDFVRGTEVGSDAYTDKKISDDYIRFWRVRDVGNDCKTWIDGNARNLTTVKPGDVVITLDGTVGKIGIDLGGAISGGLRHVVDHTNTTSNATICTILQSDYIQESLRQYVSGRGSILAHASGALRHLAIPYDKNIFGKFQNTIQSMFDLMINSKEQSKQLASLRDWLLPMLMNGQVEIKNDQ